VTYFIGVANIIACICVALTGSLKFNRFILYMSSVSLATIGIFIALFATTKVRYNVHWLRNIKKLHFSFENIQHIFFIFSRFSLKN